MNIKNLFYANLFHNLHFDTHHTYLFYNLRHTFRKKCSFTFFKTYARILQYLRRRFE